MEPVGGWFFGASAEWKTIVEQSFRAGLEVEVGTERTKPRGDVLLSRRGLTTEFSLFSGKRFDYSGAAHDPVSSRAVRIF
jgi:hypothetical protein